MLTLTGVYLAPSSGEFPDCSRLKVPRWTKRVQKKIRQTTQKHEHTQKVFYYQGQN